MENLACDIADFFVAKNWVTMEEKEVYKVGIDVFLTSLTQFVLLLILGFCLHGVTCVFIFWMCFATVREYSGGYHAPNRFLCNCTMAAAFLAVWVGSGMIICFNMEIPGAIGMSAVVAYTFWKKVPAGNSAKKITEADRKGFRGKAVRAMLLWEAVAFIVFQISITYSLQIICTEFVISILIILCKTEGRRNNEQKNERQIERKGAAGDLLYGNVDGEDLYAPWSL